MNVSAVGDTAGYLAREATGLKSGQVQQAIQASVLKKVMDQQKAAGEAIVRLVQSSTQSAAQGRVDIRV